MIDKVLSTGSGTRIAVLQEMGGQGKSQIALEYCHRKKFSLYPAIFWVDAATEDSTKRSFWAISKEIKNSTHVLSDIGARIGLVVRILSSWSIRWLLVFESFYLPPQTSPWLPQHSYKVRIHLRLCIGLWKTNPIFPGDILTRCRVHLPTAGPHNAVDDVSRSSDKIL